MVGEVVEDRGPIGVCGRRLDTVRLHPDPWNEQSIEMPEEALEAVDADAPASQPGDGPGATG